MRPSSRWAYGLLKSTRPWLAGIACGVLALGGIGVLFASPAWAPPFSPNPITVGNTYVVNTTVDGTGVGACSTGGLCSFRQAVNQYDLDAGVPSSPFLHVINEDQITFSTTITSCGQLQICNGVDPVFDIAMYGPVIFDNPNGVSVTVTGNGVTGSEGLGPAPADEINGGGSADLEIRSISNAPITLSDLTITDGSAPPPPGASSPASYCGGGILNEGGTVTVNDSNVYANTAGVQGAGICNLNGTFNLNDSTVWGNTVTPTGPGADGGGIYNGIFSNLYVNDSNIYANGDGNAGSGVDGGGIYNAQSRVQLFSSSVEANGAGNDGGGIYNAQGNVWLFSSSVVSNGAGNDGGGIYNERGSVLQVLPPSTVEDNTAATPGLGGGIYNACGAFYPGGGAGVTGNLPDNVYQQPCSAFPGFPTRPLGI